MRPQRLEPQKLERLLEVGRGLVSELDLDSVLAQVLDAARELTGARYAALGVLDEPKQELERFVPVGIDDETRERIGPLPRGHGILGELIRHPTPLRLARISDHPRSYGFPTEHPPMTTFAGAPVMIRGEVYGNLYLTQKAGGKEFDERDEELLIVLAEWAAIAIDNARSHQSVERRRGELERVVRGLQANVDLSRQIGGETGLDRVLELVVKRARDLVDARLCMVSLLEAGELVVRDVAGETSAEARGHRLPAADSPLADVLRAGVAQRVGPGALGFSSAFRSEASSGLLVPLRSRGGDLGVLVALDPEDGGEFSDDDELLLDSFAGSAAWSIASTLAIEDERIHVSISASERERERWARELHDETLQELGALKMMQEAAARLADPEGMREALLRANEQLEGLISGLHGLITELRPAALDELGAEAAIEALVDRLDERHGLAVSVDIDLGDEAGDGEARHTPELEATIYRLVQEALTNVVKHSGADHARVAIEERGGAVTLTIEDDGRGLDPPAEAGGFGLLGMRERVALIGGQFSVGPGSGGGGTRVSATLPATRRNGGGADA